MDGIADDVINEESDATHAQRLTGDWTELVWSKMMHKEIAADEVERSVGERQGERIARHCAVAAIQVGTGAVEKGNCQVKVWGKALSNLGGNKARSGGHFEQRSAMNMAFRERAADETLGCANAAEPLVEHLQIAERASDFALGSCVGVQ